MSTIQDKELCRYRYDALDRLVNTLPAAQDPAQRYYNRSRLATVMQGQIKHSVFQHDDQLLAQHHLKGQSSDTSLLTTDSQRSVLHVAASGRRNPMAYSPYGHRPVENGQLSLLGFNGEQAEPVTGHYLLGNGYRAFNPVLMRFNSPDSLSPFDKGGLNAYAYALGNPVNRVDPTGHFAFSSAVKFTGLAMTIGGTALGVAAAISNDQKLALIGIGIGVVSSIGFVGSTVFLGTSTAKISKIQSLSPDHRNVGLAEQKLFSKGGGKRLIIDGHGDGTTVGGYHPDELADAVLKKFPKLDSNFKDVKLISCHGADGGGNSYGQQLSDKLKITVKAYEGVMSGYGPQDAINSSFGRLFKYTITKKTTIKYDGIRYRYTPVFFTPKNVRNP